MLSLNQIKCLLIKFFEQHALIKQVCYEDDFDFNAERNLNYPVTNIEYLESNVNGKKTIHSFKFVLADLEDENIKGHSDEIHSDMLMLAEDFFAWAQEQEGFEFPRTVNIQKFSDDASDRTAGIVFKVQLATIRSQNACAIPLIQS